MSPRLLWFLSMLAAMTLSTWAFGWAAVVVVAAAWTWIRRTDPAVPVLAGIGGAGSWALLLGLQAMQGPVARVAEVVGAAMQVGPGPLWALTLAYPALLAGSTSSVVRAFAPRKAQAQ
ncbi:MAG: hypothetical protein KF709_13275 [Gemmatimonadaceae bacterium]|nr:hypothetical protein [Gemmatimonadaceae bacterium]